MSRVFTDVPMSRPNSNRFSLSHDVKFSCEMGKLIPIACVETLPGDVFTISNEILIRFAPLVRPVMHRINVTVHHFYVPHRILWDNWEEFYDHTITDPLQRPPIPKILINSVDALPYVGIGSLADHLGLPVTQLTGTGPDCVVNVFPFAGYQAICNEFYRDQNLVPEIDYSLADGGLNPARYPDFLTLRDRAWMHDYFTSALPWAQKGATVHLPMTGNAPVNLFTTQTNDDVRWTGNLYPGPGTIPVNVGSSSNHEAGNEDFLYADLSSVTAATINDLRSAIKLQEYYEKLARGGSRYIEQLRSMYGVVSSDARIQRPEFIGGSRFPVVISEVLQTSATDTEPTPQGNMSGHGISANSGKRFRKYCEEHGYIFSIMSVTPVTAYQQGIARHWTRNEPLDFPLPMFAHLGEQEILNKELYFSEDDNDNDGVFGYIPRYSESRYENSRVAGEFRTTLSDWHLGRIFENRPHLNQDFINCDPDTRIFAVEDEQHLWCHSFNNFSVKRRLPKYGVPRL